MARTNKHPSLICSYFLETVQGLNVVPRIVRADHGTENVKVIECQRAFRSFHDDSLARVAIMLGSSNHNQRIERFWSYMRTVLVQDYMNVLRDFVASGCIDTGDQSHMESVAFCFLPLLRRELKALMSSWNDHKIRKMKNAGCPSGIPNMLFTHPEVHGRTQEGKDVDNDTLQNYLAIYHDHGQEDFDPSFYRWACEAMARLHLESPSTLEQAGELFSVLMGQLSQLNDDSS